jgi:hypothetical protein
VGAASLTVAEEPHAAKSSAGLNPFRTAPHGAYVRLPIRANSYPAIHPNTV